MFSIIGIVHLLNILDVWLVEKLLRGLNLMRRKGESERTWLEDVRWLRSGSFFVVHQDDLLKLYCIEDGVHLL